MQILACQGKAAFICSRSTGTPSILYLGMCYSALLYALEIEGIYHICLLHVLLAGVESVVSSRQGLLSSMRQLSSAQNGVPSMIRSVVRRGQKLICFGSCSAWLLMPRRAITAPMPLLCFGILGVCWPLYSNYLRPMVVCLLLIFMFGSFPGAFLVFEWLFFPPTAPCGRR